MWLDFTTNGRNPRPSLLETYGMGSGLVQQLNGCDLPKLRNGNVFVRDTYFEVHRTGGIAADLIRIPFTPDEIPLAVAKVLLVVG
jgi:hypothetical protein